MVTLLQLSVAYYACANLTYLLLFLFSSRLVKSRSQQKWSPRTDWPRVTVLMPAHNEEKLIRRSLHSLLRNPYPNLEVIVINDGSQDKTFAVLTDEFQLRKGARSPRQAIYTSATFLHLKVLDKSNSGKSHSLNTALPFCTGTYVVTVDADTFIETDALFRAVNLIEENSNCMAVGGSVRIMNGAEVDAMGVRRGHLPKKMLSMFQIIEYIRSFFGGRLGWESLGGTALLSGAFCLFRKEALMAVGGFDVSSITEDFEIVVRMKHHFTSQGRACDLHMFPAPACWTVVPETVSSLFWQRVRWQSGLVQTLWKHKHLIFNPAAGRMGLLTLTYMLIFEALSPIAELFATMAITVALIKGRISPIPVGIGLGVGIIMYTLMTLAAVRLEETNYAKHEPKKARAKFIIFGILENLGYRQFLFAARLYGTIAGLLSGKEWGRHDRSKLEEKSAA